jgi:hypothetical protein
VPLHPSHTCGLTLRPAQRWSVIPLATGFVWDGANAVVLRLARSAAGNGGIVADGAPFMLNSRLPLTAVAINGNAVFSTLYQVPSIRLTTKAVAASCVPSNVPQGMYLVDVALVQPGAARPLSLHPADAEGAGGEVSSSSRWLYTVHGDVTIRSVLPIDLDRAGGSPLPARCVARA